MEVFTDCSGHSGDTVGHRAKRMGTSRGRSEKNAIRVCGDWSEQLSSKGKIYFYNCITEVSQWQKPPEWKLPDMDHDELLRHLRAREQFDARTLKRPRAVGASHTSNVKDADVDRRSSSPKRARYITELRNRNQAQERKPSPTSQSEMTANRANCVNPVTSRVCNQKRLNLRVSPRRTYDDRSHDDIRYTSQTRRDTGVSTTRLAPTDDMDISPNSSPMSGGSSPMHHSYHAQPAANRRMRSVQHPVPSDLNFTSTKLNTSNQSEATTPSSKSSGPLLHLVDALRASLGLFGDSPNPGGHKEVLDRFPTTNGTQFCGRTTKSTYPSAFMEKDGKYKSPSYVTHESCVRNQCLSSPEASIAPTTHLKIADRPPVGDPNARPGLPSSNAKNCTDVHRSNFAENRNRNISGLVSTLTTLVSLISNSRCVHLPTNSSPSVTIPASATSQTSYRRTAPHSYSASQRSKTQITSPAIPSPLTPSANTGTSSSGGSSSGRHAHSVLGSSGCNLSSHQMDDLLSSLENLTQQARSGPSKLTECYQPTGQRASIPSYNVHEDKARTAHRVVSPHNNRPYCWSQSRGRERGENLTNIPSLGEKFYRDSDQSNQADRINDLVKVLKSAVQQHLSTRSPISSNHNAPNPSISHSAPNRVHEPTLLTDCDQNNRGEPRIYGDSPASCCLSTGTTDPHLNRLHTNGQLLEECGRESVPSSRFVASGVSPCLPEIGATPSSHSNPALTLAIEDAGGLPADTISHGNTPGSFNPAINPSSTIGRIIEKQTPSPIDRLLDDDCLNRINRILNSSESQQFLDPAISAKYVDKAVERLEQEAQVEAKKFDRLQSVLYGELSAESKKLRALVRISEAKLAIHKEKQSALQKLMDAIETRRHLPSLSFSDDVL